MGREQAAGHGALATAITKAHGELKATWKEAREDAQRLSAANGTDELEEAIHDFLRSHRKLLGVAERLKEHLTRLHPGRGRTGESGRKPSREN